MNIKIITLREARHKSTNSIILLGLITKRAVIPWPMAENVNVLVRNWLEVAKKWMYGH